MVPDAWWLDHKSQVFDALALRRLSSSAWFSEDLKLEASVVHVFDIKREEADFADSFVKWMGRTGISYVWNYRHGGRWYYSVNFHRQLNGIVSPETAVRQCARGGRPWLKH